MRKLFREVLEIEWSFKKLPRSKKERHLPEILSTEEVQRIIKGCENNIKHQAIMITLYATGMRVGELRKLRIEDILSDRNQIRIIKGKGGKDRYINIPEVLILVLREYYKHKRPKEYLFYGKYKNNPITVSAVRWAMRQSKERIKIRKKGSPHTMRHCYATHHLESGTDLVYLQQNLGHKHLKTTARYIHLCQHRYQHITHPIDQMELPMLTSKIA
jgi:site-specific recombinase XerD